MFNPRERIALAAEDRPVDPSDWLMLVESLHAESGFWWLDSAMLDGRLGRVSFAGADPYLWLRSRGDEVEIDVQRGVRAGLAPGRSHSTADPIETARWLLPRADSLPVSTRSRGGPGHGEWHVVTGLSDGLDLPFLGGAVGYFGYELAAQIEPRIAVKGARDGDLPELSLAFVDSVLAYDHRAGRLWLLGLGFGVGDGGGGGEPLGDRFGDRVSEGDSSTEGAGAVAARRDPRAQALARSRAVVDRLAARTEAVLRAGAAGVGAAFERPPDTDGLPPSTGVPSEAEPHLDLESTTDAAGYAKAVDSILEEIARGNVYQANYSQRLTSHVQIDPWALYTRLRQENPAPFGAYLALPGGAAVLSSSPERFLRVDASRRVESRPIKGTRPRGESEFEDARLEEELGASAKDRAENLMIVDLVRNDLGRVCAPGSIEVPELMQIEAYAAVFQMVSTVTGTLAAGKDAFDLIEGTFPPGSMTGAPKLASVALLERLESVRRGVYAGALGYLDLRGGLDLSVVIRTFICQPDRVELHVGGGVVADSSPEGEYLESLDKARAPLAALDAAARARFRKDASRS